MLADFGMKDNIAIKWPNDILCGGKKLAGVLIEISAETHGVCDVIIGIGLNVNLLRADNGAILQDWTSLRQIGGEYVDRNNLSAALINHLADHVEQFERHGLACFHAAWKAYDFLAGKLITLLNGINGATEIAGIAAGINQQGHLLLELTDGNIRAFSSGDATIKKSG
jgi:BirA family biotin operon repressor/biotin-[acetyl-CoA-carboxylase] ligase